MENPHATFLWLIYTTPGSIAVTTLAAVLGLMLATQIMQAALKLAEKSGVVSNTSSTLKHLRGPARALVPLLLIGPVTSLLKAEWVDNPIFTVSYRLIFVAVITWLVINLMNALADHLLLRIARQKDRALHFRRLKTQIMVARKVATVIIMLLAIAAACMMFAPLRALGTSLLASAGIAGVIMGFSAQKVLGNLMAGIQIATTQPIRVDDVVIVEGEWGRIEEITLTYVVVRTWDKRTVIVPISQFIEKPFQNWTRNTTDLLGTATVYVDYALPLQPLREEFNRLLESERGNLWNGETSAVQVTDAHPTTMEVRFLVSADDAGKAFDLRCKVREHMLAFISSSYPQALPRTRTTLNADSSTTLETEDSSRAES